jgi:hypothetical protein
MNPAVLVAALSGDLANAVIASTPGGIEQQEAAGQAELVASGAKLPKDCYGLSREQITAETGIVFHDDADDLFVNVTLPQGWKLKATEHSMHNDLLDENGAKRAGIFYKAAFYDRKAHMSFNRRYYWQCDYAEPQSTVTVLDRKTGATLWASEPFDCRDYDAHRAHEAKASAWLEENFPQHGDKFAYWKSA